MDGRGLNRPDSDLASVSKYWNPYNLKIVIAWYSCTIFKDGCCHCLYEWIWIIHNLLSFASNNEPLLVPKIQT